MNSVLAHPSPPHQLYNTKLVPSMTFPISSSSSRKRKADDEDPRPDDRMSASPSSSPSIPSQSLPATRSIKRPRSGVVGRPLALPRLLETLEAESLRAVLKGILDHHPTIAAEVEKYTPRPSVSSALVVLRKYETKLQEAFPFGGNSSSDYAYNRVRQPLMALLDALSDFTPHFLPPHETQAASCLGFLDGATDMVHRLPSWDSFQNNMSKQNAYDEISRAWILVLREAAKRAGGIQLQYDGWDKKLAKHNQQAEGRLQAVVNELDSILGWAAGQSSAPQQQQSRNDDLSNIRQELFAGTYGSNLSVRVGPW